MVTVYAQSDAAFLEGNLDLYTERYQEAIEIQRDASMRPHAAQLFGRGQLPFPTDVMVLILNYTDLRTVFACSKVSHKMRELAFDNRIWVDFFRRFFVDFDFDRDKNSTPPFLVKHCTYLKNDPREKRSREMMKIIIQDFKLYGDPAEVEEQVPAASEEMTPFQKALLAKKGKLGNKKHVNYFQKFRSEVNFMRKRSPAIVLDINQKLFTVGVQSGRREGWTERCDTQPAIFHDSVDGPYHYRSRTFLWGRQLEARNSNDNYGGSLSVEPLWGENGFQNTTVIQEILQSFCCNQMDFCCFILDLVLQNQKLTEIKQRVECLLGRGTVFLKKLDLLVEHYGFDPRTTLLVQTGNRHQYQTVELFLDDDHLTIDLNSLSKKKILEISGKFDSLLFVGAATFGKVEKTVTTLLDDPSLKVLNGEATEDGREQVATKLALKKLRSIFPMK
jgi:hypothetical protein